MSHLLVLPFQRKETLPRLQKLDVGLPYWSIHLKQQASFFVLPFWHVSFLSSFFPNCASSLANPLLLLDLCILQLLDFLKDLFVKLFRLLVADSSSFSSRWPAILPSSPFAQLLGRVPGTSVRVWWAFFHAPPNILHSRPWYRAFPASHAAPSAWPRHSAPLAPAWRIPALQCPLPNIRVCPGNLTSSSRPHGRAPPTNGRLHIQFPELCFWTLAVFFLAYHPYSCLLDFQEGRLDAFYTERERNGLRFDKLTVRIRQWQPSVTHSHSKGKQAQQAQQSQRKTPQPHTQKNPTKPRPFLPFGHGTEILENIARHMIQTPFFELDSLSFSLFHRCCIPPVFASSFDLPISAFSFHIITRPTAQKIPCV